MEMTPTPAELSARWSTARTSLEQLIAPLTAEQLAAPSSAEAWSVKDHLIHLAMWAQGIGALLRREPRWPAMGLETAMIEADASTDEMNAAIYAQNKDRSLADVQATFAAVHADVTGIIEQMSIADLERPYAYYGKLRQPTEEENPPVWWWIVGNTADHYAEHHEWIAEMLAHNGWQTIESNG